MTSSSSASRTVESRCAMTSEVRPRQGLAQGALHGRLGLGVQVGRGLVEHDDVGRLEDEPGQGDPLLLAAREPVAPLADDRVEAVGQLADQVADLGLGEGGQDLLLARLRAGVHQVGPQRVVEEVRVLGHHADHVADRGHGGVAHVDAVEAHRTRRHVVEAGDQVEMVVLPAPDGPTSATMWPGSTVKETSWRTSLRWPASSTATDSSEASETSSALG